MNGQFWKARDCTCQVLAGQAVFGILWGLSGGRACALRAGHFGPFAAVDPWGGEAWFVAVAALDDVRWAMGGTLSFRKSNVTDPFGSPSLGLDSHGKEHLACRGEASWVESMQMASVRETGENKLSLAPLILSLLSRIEKVRQRETE